MEPQKTIPPKNIPKVESQPGSGIRSMDATTVFRVTNFELFMKPNKFVMAFGLIAMTACTGYLFYWNQVEKNNAANNLYTAINDDETVSIRARKSRWE